ncbi:hypothetical protein U9M48_002563 [Paspalum notatum var. saurae]|uniref:Uncharacterized protein n=1 Tax=Paspalum notatum var. saurae TaxID=547442 RepID=A0AAQ3PG66_PASNO
MRVAAVSACPGRLRGRRAPPPSSTSGRQRAPDSTAQPPTRRGLRDQMQMPPSLAGPATLPPPTDVASPTARPPAATVTSRRSPRLSCEISRTGRLNLHKSYHTVLKKDFDI